MTTNIWTGGDYNKLLNFCTEVWSIAQRAFQRLLDERPCHEKHVFCTKMFKNDIYTLLKPKDPGSADWTSMQPRHLEDENPRAPGRNSYSETFSTRLKRKRTRRRS